MASVASRTPGVKLYGFDMWLSGYGGSENPGSDFIKNELKKVGYTQTPILISGNSHETLPAFFGDSRASWWKRRSVRKVAGDAPSAFELMLVDGDHSLLGAYQDLMDTLPHLAVGGVLVFDDVAPGVIVDPDATQAEAGPDPEGWGDLLGVWRADMERFPDYRSFEYLANPPGVAMTVRLR